MLTNECLFPAKTGGRDLQNLSGVQRSDIILQIADLLSAKRADILSANEVDLNSVEEKNVSSSMIDRLKLTDSKIESLVTGQFISSVL